MLRVKILLFVLAAAVLSGQAPDLILVNGKIWTVAERPPTAEAVACAGGKILVVGSSAEIGKLAGPGAGGIDLGGEMVCARLQNPRTLFFIRGARAAPG